MRRCADGFDQPRKTTAVIRLSRSDGPRWRREKNPTGAGRRSGLVIAAAGAKVTARDCYLCIEKKAEHGGPAGLAFAAA
jgi:hypothetical protein